MVSVLMVSTAACSSGNDSGEAVSQEKEVAKERNNVTFTDISKDIRGNKAPTPEQADEVNRTLNDTYLEDMFEETIPNNYSAYPYKADATLNDWMPANPSIPDMNNQAVQKQVEQLTGIKVNFITPPVGQEADAFTLMISSGELPDIIINPERYPGGLEAELNDGAYMDLTDFL